MIGWLLFRLSLSNNSPPAVSRRLAWPYRQAAVCSFHFSPIYLFRFFGVIRGSPVWRAAFFLALIFRSGATISPFRALHHHSGQRRRRHGRAAAKKSCCERQRTPLFFEGGVARTFRFPPHPPTEAAAAVGKRCTFFDTKRFKHEI